MSRKTEITTFISQRPKKKKKKKKQRKRWRTSLPTLSCTFRFENIAWSPDALSLPHLRCLETRIVSPFIFFFPNSLSFSNLVHSASNGPLSIFRYKIVPSRYAHNIESMLWRCIIEPIQSVPFIVSFLMVRRRSVEYLNRFVTFQHYCVIEFSRCKWMPRK